MTSGAAELPPPELSIVLATFNERENLPRLLDRIRAVSLPPCEVLIVDDGSTDGTREYLESAARSDARLRPIWHEGKQTTLRAQCQGISDSRGRFIIIMDADLQHPPEVLPAMVRALEDGAALVVGSRYAPGGSAGPRTWIRAAISRGAEWTAKVVLPEARAVSDPVSGLFGFRRAIFRPIPTDWRGYKLLLVLLVMGRGQRVAEVGYPFEPRASGSSKVTENSRFVRFFLMEVAHARRFRRILATLPSTVPEPGQRL
ncbi:MAG TPA: glycosyltransferase [Thermoplasmata archaeon]|jgi:dolichol-phosphate mannosyltransferase|nr:glycosyltransferase [Thermoplasmata archaeon]